MNYNLERILEFIEGTKFFSKPGAFISDLFSTTKGYFIQNSSLPIYKSNFNWSKMTK